MDYRRDPLLAVDRALREATQRYEQRPTPEHARGATAYEALAAVASEMGRGEWLKAGVDSTKRASATVRRRPARPASPPNAPGTGGVERPT